MEVAISNKFRKYFKGFCTSPELIMLFVYMKSRFSLSYRELEEIAIIKSIKIDHSTLARWVAKFTFIIGKQVRKYKKPTNTSWRMDETYIKVKGEWVYLYRAVDKYGNTIDFLLRKHRAAEDAKAFFNKAIKSNSIPRKVVIDKSGSNISALGSINKPLAKEDMIEVCQQKYCNNIIEQDHRFIKKRVKPMLGFKSFTSAKNIIEGIETVRMIQKNQFVGCNSFVSTFQNFCTLMA